jgi:hypothetical protein
MTMGLFGPSKAASLNARHAAEDKAKQKAKKQVKADNAKYGRKGGILCGRPQSEDDGGRIPFWSW